jgi:hypothetical protein
MPALTDLARRAPRWAAMAILALGVWGMLIAEPYWRAVGHGPTAFTWASWTAIVLSAPASLLARPAAQVLFEREIELVFVLEHILWAALIVLQWHVLRRAAAWLRPARKWTLFAAALSAIGLVAGIVSWAERWPLVHGEDISWNLLDRPIGIFGLALVPPAWLLLQRRYHQAGTTLETLRRNRRRWRLWTAGSACMLLMLGWLAVLSAQPGSQLFALAYRDEFRRSEIAIQAIDSFRRDHGRVPDSLEEAGLPLEQFDERCPCYEKQTEQSYIVWFGWTLGESVVYDSLAGKWQY